MKAFSKRVLVVLFICNLFSTYKSHAQAEENDSIYTVVERMPEFPGGDRELMMFINRKLQAPVIMDDDYYYLHTRIVTTFVIEKDGTISNIKIKRPEEWGDLCKAEMPALGQTMIDMIESFPTFKPGMQNGIPVRVQYTLPVHLHFK